MPSISFFSTLYSTQSQPYCLEQYVSDVQSGKWRLLLERFRTDWTLKLYALPGITFSGISTPTKTGLTLTAHSGVVALILEGFKDLERGKQMLAQDRYTYAVFGNLTQTSLTVLVRVDGSEHEKAFKGLSEYYENHYGLISDPTCALPTCVHVVSDDPTCALPTCVHVVSDDPTLRCHPNAQPFTV